MVVIDCNGLALTPAIVDTLLSAYKEETGKEAKPESYHWVVGIEQAAAWESLGILVAKVVIREVSKVPSHNQPVHRTMRGIPMIVAVGIAKSDEAILRNLQDEPVGKLVNLHDPFEDSKRAAGI